MRNIIAAATGVMVLLGLFLCYLLTKRNSKPLRMMIRALTTVYDHGRFDPEDDFKFIENAVSALVASNTAIHQKEKDMKGKLDREVLWRLFLGEGTQTAAFQEELRNSSIQLEDHRFITGYLHVHGLENTRQAAFFTENSLYNLLENLCPESDSQVFPMIIDRSNLVFLAVCQDKTPEETFCRELSQQLEALGERIERETECHLDFFLSEPMRLPDTVQKGYQQCKDLALRVVKNSSQFVYTVEDLPRFQQIYRYSIDQELRLTQLLQYGTPEELREFLRELYEQNLERQRLSDGMKKSFFAAV